MGSITRAMVPCAPQRSSSSRCGICGLRPLRPPFDGVRQRTVILRARPFSSMRHAARTAARAGRYLARASPLADWLEARAHVQESTRPVPSPCSRSHSQRRPLVSQHSLMPCPRWLRLSSGHCAALTLRMSRLLQDIWREQGRGQWRQWHGVQAKGSKVVAGQARRTIDGSSKP